MRNRSLQLPYPLSRSSRNRRRLMIICGEAGKDIDSSHSSELNAPTFVNENQITTVTVPNPAYQQSQSRSNRSVSRLPLFTGLRRLFQNDDSLLWVFAGDGMTKGLQKMGEGEPFSNLFADFLHSGLHRLQDDVVNVATTTETAEQLFDSIDNRLLRLLPDVVSISLSFNDCIKRRSQQKLFQNRLVNIIETIRQSKAIPLLHTPHRVDLHRNPQLTGLPIYVKTIREIAREEEVPCIDHWEHWKPLSNDRIKLSKLLADDGMHLNAKGNLAVTRLIIKRLRQECGLPKECDIFSKSVSPQNQVPVATATQHSLPLQ